MFIRKVKQKKKGQDYFTYRIVESVRTEAGPRQRLMLNLGPDFALPREDWKGFCQRIQEKLTGYEASFDTDPFKHEELAESLTQKIIKNHSTFPDAGRAVNTDYSTIDLNSIKHNNIRTIGGEYTCLDMIRHLGLDTKLSQLGFNSKQLSMAIGTIISRLLQPGSDRSSFFWPRQRSALGELIDFDFNATTLNRFYETADQLFSKKQDLETWLYTQEQKLFSLKESIILYDLTNTFFEGSGQFNDKAKFGRSKEKRSDAPLVTLGLVLDGSGFPKRSEVLPGNVSEPGTLEQMLDKLLPAAQNIMQSTVILDAGIATSDNLKWLKANSFHYVVVARNKPTMPEVGDFVPLQSQEEGEEGVRGKLVRNEETMEWELYCHSPKREQKEGAMKSKFCQRMEEDLTRSRSALSKKQGIKKLDKVNQRIGRIKQKYTRVSSLFEIEIISDEAQEKAIDIRWEINPEKEKKKLTGIYCLKTNIEEVTAQEIWDIYITLNQVEEAFRCMKTELGMRPVYHQKECRVDAHLFITLLAYHVLHSIRHRLKQCGVSYSWESLRKILSSQFRNHHDSHRSGKKYHSFTKIQLTRSTHKGNL